jgi:hypothetical protein
MIKAQNLVESNPFQESPLSVIDGKSIATRRVAHTRPQARYQVMIHAMPPIRSLQDFWFKGH